MVRFRAVIVLKPSFPAFVTLSHTLDMTDDNAMDEVARLLRCVSLLLRTELTESNSNTIEEMCLDLEYYHLKRLSDFFCSTGQLQSSLNRYFKIMSCLHKSDCRDYVVFPISVREYGESTEESSIVFPNLSDYKIGLPASQDERYSYLSILRCAISRIHAAGVVHMDLYPSNVMWKLDKDNGLKLKIIDWDAAVYCDDDLPQDVIRRLEKSCREDVHKKAKDLNNVSNLSREMENQYYDLSLIHVLACYIDEPRLQSHNKEVLDGAFIDFQNFYCDLNAA